VIGIKQSKISIKLGGVLFALMVVGETEQVIKGLLEYQEDSDRGILGCQIHSDCVDEA
jgi:hypothetical protein